MLASDRTVMQMARFLPRKLAVSERLKLIVNRCSIRVCRAVLPMFSTGWRSAQTLAQFLSSYAAAVDQYPPTEPEFTCSCTFLFL